LHSANASRDARRDTIYYIACSFQLRTPHTLFSSLNSQVRSESHLVAVRFAACAINILDPFAGVASEIGLEIAEVLSVVATSYTMTVSGTLYCSLSPSIAVLVVSISRRAGFFNMRRCALLRRTALTLIIATTSHGIAEGSMISIKKSFVI
jgi:hypothetical protein